MTLHRSARPRWSPLAVAIVAACASLPLQAQSDEPTELERIEVTGSRIKRAAIEGQSPVFTLTREDIAQSGLTSVGDVLQQLTTGGKALNSKFNSSGNFGYPPDGGGIGAGSSQVDLRHLESKRVLVLVDGLRWVNESSASGVGSATDLNTIPLAIVDRIEVLEDGASAIYGSDAIAGVVNIITRRDFKGAELTTYYGEYDEGDGETTRAEATIGGGGDGFNAVFSASYVEQKTVFSRDRAQALEPVPGTGVTRGSSATPQGRFIFSDPRTGGDLDITLNPGTATPVYNPANPTGGTSTYNPFDITDRFNFSPFNLVLTPNKRKSLFTQVSYDLSDNVALVRQGPLQHPRVGQPGRARADLPRVRCRNRRAGRHGVDLAPESVQPVRHRPGVGAELLPARSPPIGRWPAHLPAVGRHLLLRHRAGGQFRLR